jgi:[protein-PII] uridylyltransferase
MFEVRAAFEANPRLPTSGTKAVAARSGAVDELIASLWAGAQAESAALARGVTLVAVGGYGRRELFPYSDVDLMFLLAPKLAERDVKEPIRRLNQHLWDCGLRLSPMTRSLTECERFNPENVEFTLALLDARFLLGDEGLFERLAGRAIPRLIGREHTKIVARLAEVTRVRHQKYGNTLFHLEPNIKDCPGGLRDAHVCAWLDRLGDGPLDGAGATQDDEFCKAREFLLLVRTFLHLRHQRDDNTLDWHAQDQAAAVALGVGRGNGAAERGGGAPDAAYWMRLYFRHARSVERAAAQALEDAVPAKRASRVPGMAALRRLASQKSDETRKEFELKDGCVVLQRATASGDDPAHDPEVMLAVFAAVARSGARLSRETEQRLEGALPLLSAHLEDGPGLWRHLELILTAPHAGGALRAMHAMGILELVLPEFHGIDALVIRDAYHRYTVDEHTFVVIDTLHALLAPVAKETSGLAPWAAKFAPILKDLPHPGLLFLAALLHDTGKGHSAAGQNGAGQNGAGQNTGHAEESVRLAEHVVRRLELDSYEAGLVLGLIRNHLEMSAALRRDVFEAETIRTFAARVPNPEALRMLTLFTYADIFAVHPDALTPWKAENLHHLYVATAHFLDRNVDDERVGSMADAEVADSIHRVAALLPGEQAELERFLAGLPQRYLLTRTREQIKAHFEMAKRLGRPGVMLAAAEGVVPEDEVQLQFQYAPESSEITLVSRDRPMLFATMAGALAAWGMDIVTADAFSNAEGVVVDRFRFHDSFRTLELNESERERFVESVRNALTGAMSVESLLAGRRRGRRKARKIEVESHIAFDDAASVRSTLVEVVAEDTPGILRAVALTLGARGCSIEVALVDTEGEVAIDVFYVTRGGEKLEKDFQDSLRRTLLEAIEENAH